MSRSSQYEAVPPSEIRQIPSVSALSEPESNRETFYNHALAPPSVPYGIAPSINSTPRGSAYDNVPGTPPRDSFTPRGSFMPDNSAPLLTATEKINRGEDGQPRSRSIFKRPAFWILLVLAIIIVVVAVVVPVYFKVIKPNQKNNVSSGSSSGSGPTGSGPGNSGGGNSTTPSGAISGGDGSLVTMDDGSTFTYSNQFGGFCEFSNLCLIPSTHV